MGILKIIIIFCFCGSYLISSDVYIPRNEKEKEYLQNIRKQKLILGKKTNYFADDKIDGESLNDIIEEMLTEYLKLDISTEKKPWIELKNEFKAGNIDLLNFLTYSEKRSSYAFFTNGIIEENLIIVSKDKKMNTVEDLNEMIAYISEDTIYEAFLKRFINKNDLTLKYKTLDDVEIEKKYPYVTSDLNTIGEKNTLILGRVPNASIGVSRKYPELVKIINNSLEKKYAERVNNWIQKRQELILQKKIEEVLTETEKEYLKNLGVVSIAYKNIDKISKYSNQENRFTGIGPRILTYLGDSLGIEIKEQKNKNFITWEDTKKYLISKDLNIMLLSKVPEKEKDLVFTKKITDLKVYEIKNIDLLNNFKKERIGVIKGSLEERLAREYFQNENIAVYLNENRLLQDFKNKKLVKILTLNVDRYDITSYDVSIFEILPINIAF
ncbi:MAG: hypothetical protein ACRC0F_11290, partial [Cetobacterium sp.]